MKLDDLSAEEPNLQRAADLISALFDHHISEAEHKELESLLLTDDRVCRLYVCQAHLQAGLYKYASALGRISHVDLPIDQELAGQTGDMALNETMVLPAISKALDEHDFAEGEEEKFIPAPYSPPVKVKPGPNWSVLSGVAAVAVCAVGLVAYLLVWSHRAAPNTGLVQHPLVEATTLPVETPPPVASLVLASKPVWESSYIPPADGNFESGSSLSLVTGAVQLGLPAGGRLVVEGPAQLDFVSVTRLFLHSGKMVALIPGGGLVVECPGGVITDLGTEFGVDVHSGGGADVAVFQGSVSAALSATPGTPAPAQTLLKVGQAALISGEKIELRPEGAIQQRYLCSLENQNINSLDVTDLVSGGDGSTHRRGIAIDSVTGEIGKLQCRGNRKGDGAYHRIQGYPVLDGTFIPDGPRGSMVVDSAGDQSVFVTASSETHNLIETGGRIRWDDAAGISTVLGNVDYSLPGHGIICSHSNNALTLDLDAVRRLYPDRSLSRFRCRVGNSYIDGWHGALKTNPLTGAFVLINGKARYSQPRFSNHDGPFLVDLPLTTSDRFLTLVATDANTNIDQDWILWADAQIDLTGK